MKQYPLNIIAIDGTSASGKGTLAKKLAAHFDFAYLDTGLLYRAVGLAVLRAGGDPVDAQAAEAAAKNLNFNNFSDPALRDDVAAVAASKVGAVPAVRQALVQFQRDFIAHPPDGKKGAVLDGRDIGTVIAPEAPVKIFITAELETRAMRRFKELEARNEPAIYKAVLDDMRQRDERDRSRATAPTVPAADATILDTTHMTANDVFQEALKIAENKLIKVSA
jgi:cytidylate kinase